MKKKRLIYGVAATVSVPLAMGITVRPQKSQVSVLKKLAEKRLETATKETRERGTEPGEKNL